MQPHFIAHTLHFQNHHWKSFNAEISWELTLKTYDYSLKVYISLMNLFFLFVEKKVSCDIFRGF